MPHSRSVKKTCVASVGVLAATKKKSVSARKGDLQMYQKETYQCIKKTHIKGPRVTCVATK